MKMPSWHDIKSLTSIDAEECKGLPESKARIEQLIKFGNEQYQIPYDKIVLGGFSQGAAMAAVTGYQFPQRLAGIVCLSGYFPSNIPMSSLVSEAQKSTPSLVCHGDADPVVNPKAGQKLSQEIKNANIPIDFKTYRGMAHSTSPQEMKDLVNFITKVLPK